MSNGLSITKEEFNEHTIIKIRHTDSLFSVRVVALADGHIELNWSHPDPYEVRALYNSSDPELIATLDKARMFQACLNKAIEIAEELKSSQNE